MSNWQDQLGGEEETRALVDWLAESYHYPVLLVVVAFAFLNRVRNYSNFIVDGEILYSGNDPWYHMRSTEYVINNFPETMPFDPWTFFPHGTVSGQFGTLYDQLVGLVALVVGLGAPGEFMGRFVLLIAPAVFGTLVCVPAYFIGKRLGGRFGGIIAVMFVAFAPDRLLEVSLAGNPQHHAAEVLFLGLTVLGFMVALRAAERELPVAELVRSREFGLLRETVGWSLLAGVALGAYMWVWPPGAWMYGIIGVFFVVHMMAEHLRSRSPEHTAFVGVIAFATAGLLQLGMVRTLEFSATSRSLLQPGMGLAGALGIVVLAWLSREIHRRDLSRTVYPASVAGSLVAGALLVALLLPGVFSFFAGEFDRVFGATIDWADTLLWFVDISSEEGALATIGEGTPGDVDDLTDFYQFAIFTALLGGLGLLGRQILDERPKGEELLIVVLSVFLVVATFTQIRFAYYLTLVIGALNAALVGFIMRLAGAPDSRSLPETYQILTIIVVVFVMFVPLLGLPLVGGGDTATGVADARSQPGSVVGWSDSLDWMSENTPPPGTYANPDGEPMEYYGQYGQTDDFDYPDGAYGVLSWWDYGHWITAKGERPANANPFQQNVRPAADFLLAQDEEEALAVLEEDFSDHENAGTQYVMVDSLMVETETLVGGKFFAPPDFHSEFERGDFYRRLTSDTGSAGIVHKQAYYESMMVRLYHYHGSEKQPEPFITQWAGQEQRSEDGTAFVEMPQNTTETPIVEFVDNMTAAQERTTNNPTNQIGGIGANPAEEVPALEHFRLVHDDAVPAVPGTGGDDTAFQDAADRGLNIGSASVALQRTLPLLDDAANSTLQGQEDQLDFLYDTTPSFTKTFERVPGATIEGSVPENATENELLNLSAGDGIGIRVPIDPPNGEEFTYSQTVELDENLEFSATVPYSTEGYDEWGVEEGYTNVSARASGPYTIQTQQVFDSNESEFVWYGADVNVTEGQVIGEEDPTVTVELEERTRPFDLNLGGGGGTGDGGGDDGGGSDPVGSGERATAGTLSRPPVA